MAELDVITEDLRRQRKDLDKLIESGSSRSTETAELAGKIDQLRRRAEETTRTFEATLNRRSKPTK
ncbi:MAG TPA: hypothetical protein VN605_02810 [Thermoanaerobaculia bacterium]|nr:hypothetical protein [Thermoanaerobaculia bacterium]